ncbi:MAG: hypothetical protein ACPLRX_10515 [Candidatus Saccharicenans sp.]
MDEKKLQSFFRQATDLLKEFLPPGATVVAPFLYTLAVWGLKKQTSYREQITGLQVWLLPEAPVNKPDEFILNFFKSEEKLKQAYRDEIAAGNLTKLRQDFAILYPLLGLQDPFLEGLFWPEIESGKFKEIVAGYRPKVEKAWQEIKAAKDSSGFWSAVGKISTGFLELGWQELSEPEVRGWIRRWLKSQ